MTHTSSESAYKCYSSYLISQGYIAHGAHGFIGPSGAILILDKKSKFGAVMRSGKEDKSGQRIVPSRGSGIII